MAKGRIVDASCWEKRLPATGRLRTPRGKAPPSPVPCPIALYNQPHPEPRGPPDQFCPGRALIAPSMNCKCSMRTTGVHLGTVPASGQHGGIRHVPSASHAGRSIRSSYSSLAGPSAPCATTSSRSAGEGIAPIRPTACCPARPAGTGDPLGLYADRTGSKLAAIAT